MMHLQAHHRPNAALLAAAAHPLLLNAAGDVHMPNNMPRAVLARSLIIIIAVEAGNHRRLRLHNSLCLCCLCLHPRLLKRNILLG